MEIKTMEQLQHEYFAAVLTYYNGNRAQTARALGLSIKTIYNYLKNCREFKSPILVPSEKKPEDFNWSAMPTNEYRCEYQDKLINRNTM